MGLASSTRITLCTENTTSAEDIRRFLEQAGLGVTSTGLANGSIGEVAGSSLVVVDGTGNTTAALHLCGRLRGQAGDGFVPILFVTGDPTPTARLASLECGADTYLLRPFESAELLAQVNALLRIKERHDRLTEKTAEVHRINKRLQSAYQQIDRELELASRIQLSFLPQTLPEVPQARFAVHYQPCGRVGGDFYDVFRLDENHLGFYVADAMGHGVPASLLTIFVKKGVKAKDISGRDYRLVPPNEVLERLNRDLIDQSLSEHPFITMVYVLFNYRDGTLQFARSGHPYPLYLPREGEPELWQVEGTLLGVFDTKYTVRTQRLRPGDKVLLYTDGVDGASPEPLQPGAANLLACAARHREMPIQELVDQLAKDLFPDGKQADDLTLLGLEMLA